jgi:hypothetical protein
MNKGIHTAWTAGLEVSLAAVVSFSDKALNRVLGACADDASLNSLETEGA